MNNSSKLFAIVVGLAVLSAIFTLAMPDGMAPSDTGVSATPPAPVPVNTGTPQPAVSDQSGDNTPDSYGNAGPAISNPTPPPPSDGEPVQNL